MPKLRLKVRESRSEAKVHVEFQHAEAWSTFRLDGDTDMAYFILKGNPSQSYEGLDAENLAHQAANIRRLVIGGLTDSAFMMTIFTDVFQTIESLTQIFSLILQQHPRGRVLFIGYPTRALKTVGT